ncbi:hypothetical protein ACWET9_48815 [Streptomyces sp. NPDC004059]
MEDDRRRQFKRSVTEFLLGVLYGAGKVVGSVIAVAVLLHFHG